jgi:hypothetical protein
MVRKYKIGEKVVINYGNDIIDAEVFAHINLDLGTKAAYSLRMGTHFIFVEEKDIIERANEQTLDSAI